jgi:hypothetical protein
MPVVGPSSPRARLRVWTLLGLALFCSGALEPSDAFAQQWEALKPISEETPPAICSLGYALSHLRCRGSYCDDVVATCARYAMPPASAAEAAPYWTAWFSEEKSGHFINGSNFPRLSDDYSVAVGVQCRGRYCDDMRLLMQPMRGRNAPTMDSKAEYPICRLSSKFSEETPLPAMAARPRGKAMEFVRRIGCSGDYCDNLTIEWCRVWHDGWRF